MEVKKCIYCTKATNGYQIKALSSWVSLPDYKEYEINGTTYFVEQHFEKGAKVGLWRYGYLCTTPMGTNFGQIIKKDLLSRPNLKKLFGK